MLYGLATCTSVVAGLASVAILTRYLSPAAYGRLGILLAGASLLTVGLNAGLLQGTNAWVFGSVGDDEGDVPDTAISSPGAVDRRRGLMTGLTLTAAVGGIATLAVTAAAGPLAQVALGSSTDRWLVVWAAIAGALAAIFRLAANAIRLERRPVGYLVAAGSQHLLPIACSVPFLVAGWGVGGAIGGTVIGNAGATLVALALIRNHVRAAVSRHDALQIIRRGRAMVPVVAGMHFIQLADVLLLSRFVTTGQVGMYRVAARIATFVSYWTTSFQMAWGPLRRDPVHVAAERERGPAAVTAIMSTYFVLITVGVVLAASLFATQLVAIAAPGYGRAADFIPLAAMGWACHGFFVLVYRTSDFPSKRNAFVGLTIVNAVVFFGSAQIWVPLLGVYGISAAVVTGWSVGTAALMWLAGRHPDPTPYQWRRMGVGLLMAGACFAAGRGLAPPDRWLQLVLDTVVLVAYPVLLVALRVVPGQPITGALELIRANREDRRRCRPSALLTREDHGVLDELLRRRGPADDPKRDADLVQALRRWAGVGTESANDADVGAFILRSGTFAEDEAAAADLLAAGTDPLELDALLHAAQLIRRMPNRRWSAMNPASITAAEQQPRHAQIHSSRHGEGLEENGETTSLRAPAE